MNALYDRSRHKLANLVLQLTDHWMPVGADRIATLVSELTSLNVGLAGAHRRLDVCQQRNWQHATRYQAHALYRLCTDTMSIAATLREATQTLTAPPDPTPLTMREILQDFAQLEDEFDHVAFDARDRTVTVRTDAITLDGLYLGPFEIVLKLYDPARSQRRPSYKIVATDPHPASSNENVTHPHVRDEELCEGEATVPIRHALEQGRICDFFLLVRSVLTTYNAGSPYVAIDDWEGISCHDCGSTVNRDDVSYCDGCDRDFCSECMGYCRTCDDGRCHGCLEDCSACGDSLCKHCRKTCKDCGAQVCDGCLEEGLCPACREKVEPEDDASKPTPPSAQPQAA